MCWVTTSAPSPQGRQPQTLRPIKSAVAILKRYRIWQAVPQRVRRHLDRGCQGLASETPKPGSSLFRRVHHHIVGNNAAAVRAVARAAREAGLRTLVHTPALTGEARDEGQRFGAPGQEYCARGQTAAEALLCGGWRGNHRDRHWKGNRREGARVRRSRRSGNCRSGQGVGGGDRYRWHRWSD